MVEICTIELTQGKITRVSPEDFDALAEHRPDNGKWAARIGFRGKRITLGSFDTKEEAMQARKDAAKELHSGFTRSN
jgi:hypothetical protein